MVVAANVVTEKDGVPVLYDGCKRGFGVRVVHAQNPKAPSKSLSVTMLYLAPGGILEPHHHENEEVYVILEGEGLGFFGLGKPIAVRKGMFMHLPPNAEHGLENTGDEMMKVLICTSPPFGPLPEWKTRP
ncbi:MAG: cupin domain-containing protein [Candidatus Bathyarchaeia archaeon]